MERSRPSPRVTRAVALVPLLGTLALLPPLITLFATDWRPFGVPLIVFYLFGVWALLVVAAAAFARHVDEPADVDDPPPQADQPVNPDAAAP